VVGSLLKYREFIWQHALADVRHRYAGTGMGVVWNVLHPLGMIAIYSAVFSTIFKSRLDHYELYLCAGFFPWIAFGECLTRGCAAFSANAAYMKKLPIPEQVFVAQTAASASIGLVISFSLLLIVALALGLRPTWHWMLLPIPLILLQAVGFGLGMILGTLNVFFQDVAQLLTIGLQILFWLTPIVYPWRLVPAWLQPVLAAHPATPAIEAVRALFLKGALPPTWVWPALGAWAVGTSLLGYLVLGALRDEIRDNL
jgi:ABC-type polysaccharide/polyol phosphate export permease